jgi:mannosyltransferase OCH1-like enzyme
MNQRKWAFASDYMRLKVLFDHGGIYLDTDMEVVKDFSIMLRHELFLGYESGDHVGVGILGATKGHPVILRAMKIMEARVEKNMPFISIPNILKEAFETLPEPGVEQNGMIAYPRQVFYPYNPYVMDRKQMLAADIKEDTYAIHHWDGSWVSNGLGDRIVRVVRSLLGRYGLL